MTYDASKDRELMFVGEFESGKTKLTVRLMAYDGGSPKILVERFLHQPNGWLVVKVGRMTLNEAEAVARMMLIGSQELNQPDDDPFAEEYWSKPERLKDDE